MEEVRSFKRVERSYHSTPNGWRLATFEEAEKGLEEIKQQSLLKKWDRARLLDGWISGPGYDYQRGNDFRSCMGYMLLIQTQTATQNSSGCAYGDVNINDSQKEVALFLCADDFNYEVVYWLFNSWAKTDIMDLQDVIQGRIPFSNLAKFKEMNSEVCSLARKLGDKGPVSGKADRRRFSGPESVKDVLSDMIEIVNKENIQKYIHPYNSFYESCFPKSLEPAWLKDFAEQGGADWNNIADAIWNFLSESFAESMVEIFAIFILGEICKLYDGYDLQTTNSSQKNFMVASFILFYLSYCRTDIVHTSLAHQCRDSCAAKMIRYVASNNEPADLPHFNQTLQSNAMWRCDNQIGNYDLLNKLLVLAAGGGFYSQLQMKEKTDILVLNRLLECGAHPGPAYALFNDKKLTALQGAIGFLKDDHFQKEVAETLLSKCDEQQQQQLVNTPDENRWTPLHVAAEQGSAQTCQMLLKYGAKAEVLDGNGQTALHRAVKRGRDAVVNVFMKHSHIVELVDVKDKMGESHIDTAISKKDIKLVAKLIPESKNPETYFHKVDLQQLLRHSLLNGSVNIVRNLFGTGTKLPAGGCDDDGKTALHLAAMCEDNKKSMEMVLMVCENVEGKENLVAKGDRRGRTALHEAALNGNAVLCRYLLRINPKIINLKDRDGRDPIYDAAQGKQNEERIIRIFLNAYSKRDILLNASIDRNGMTPLHVAASLGKKDLVKLLLSSQKNGKEYLQRRDLVTQEASEYLKRSDFLGQTALHKAANCGDPDTVEILLNEGAHPLQERDCDGRTALHYAVKAKTGGDKIELAKLLLQTCKTKEEKFLLLWASAAGVGTADQSLSNDDPLHQFLVGKKDEIKKQLPTANLLKTATSVGDIEMTKELIARGYQIADIHDTEWRKKLTPEGKENVKRVSDQLERIAEQGNDQPTVLDNLGRIDYAYGLAALLLNPYIKPPIVVGISGSWGMGKSSLMVQTESILLKTAAQMALLSSAKLSSSASELPEITTSALSKKGKKKYEEIKRYVDYEQKGNRTLFSSMICTIRGWLKKSNTKESGAETGHSERDSLADFLNNYQVRYHKIFKSLAAMDSTNMFTKKTREIQEHQNSHSKTLWRMVRDKFTTNAQRPKSSVQQSIADSPEEGSVPAVLTVQYNAWKYRNETEALAGMAVEITKELEGTMTKAQWLSTCWRNSWKKKKYNIWVEIIYPCLLAVVLACTFTWILWLILDRSDKFKNWAIPKYACLPTTIVIIGWTLTKSAMGILKPVSSQLMSYISFPDHTDKLGYQERVISDITFLKKEIGRKPCMVFKVYSWVCTVISILWLLFFGKTMPIQKIAPASRTNLRIIVFIDDLDRCQESVILQVLSAINLVLAVCEISVVLGIDKGLIERAIIKKYGDKRTDRSFKDNEELADKYLQKIIQLPLDLPDPSEKQSQMFLKGQLGVFQEPNEGADSELKPDEGKPKILRHNIFEQEAGRSRESTLSDITERETGPVSELAIDVPPSTVVTGCGCPRLILQFIRRQLCKLPSSCPSVFCGRKDEREATTSDAAGTLSVQTAAEARQQGEVNKISNRNYSSWIPIREMLFVRYSKGEQDAFCEFQKLATDSRKLPREWKRHLTYHRLVWNIFYLTGEAKDLAGWQVQLITWIFVCWEWRENMNIVIQNWNKIRILERPSLHMIVDYFIELESKESLKMTATKHEEEETNRTSISKDKNIETESSELEQKKLEEPDTKHEEEETKKTSISKDKNIETESGKLEQKKLEEPDKHNVGTEDFSPPLFQRKNKKKKKEKKKNNEVRETSLEGNIDDQKRSKRTGPEKLDSAVNKQLGTIEETLRKELDELKKEIKHLKLDELKKEIKHLKLDELKKEINDLKDEVMKQQSRKNEKREDEKRMKLERWKTLRSALYKYDVPMDAIKAFQRFRFYCVSGHLSWPLPEQVRREKNIDNHED